MENLIVIAIVLVIVGLACLYIYREKKKGKVCVGCPYGGTCGKSNCSGCGSGDAK